MTHICIQCGEIDGEQETSSNYFNKCGTCKKYGVLSIENTVDLLMSLRRTGALDEFINFHSETEIEELDFDDGLEGC
jgi:hypothetical protein